MKCATKIKGKQKDGNSAKKGRHITSFKIPLFSSHLPLAMATPWAMTYLACKSGHVLLLSDWDNQSKNNKPWLFGQATWEMNNHWATNCSRPGVRGQETQQLKPTLGPALCPSAGCSSACLKQNCSLNVTCQAPASTSVRLRMHKGVVESSVCSLYVDFGNYLYCLFILFLSHFLCYGKQKPLAGSRQSKRISPEEAPAFCCGSFFALMSKQIWSPGLWILLSNVPSSLSMFPTDQSSPRLLWNICFSHLSDSDTNDNFSIFQQLS